MPIFDKLVELRKKMNVKQKSIADKLRVDVTTLNKMERDVRRVDYYLLEDYAKELGFEITLTYKGCNP
ncbi:helix-turn-helix transcriptional regulator [Candidatus Bathyarchaeota archaeon]|nr:helix-turn-helix transcriptional regulator [Candidatus Bathyarchaeota archaeon]